jgi:hypothetical protein
MEGKGGGRPQVSYSVVPICPDRTDWHSSVTAGQAPALNHPAQRAA